MSQTFVEKRYGYTIISTHNKETLMNSGTSSTELNDMFTEFVNYVDSFYGQNDPLYPMMSQRDLNNLLLSLTSYRATENYLSMCSDKTNKYCE